MIGNSVADLCIDHHSIKCDQVRNEQTNLLSFIQDIERRLLLKRNFPQTKLDDQRIFVWLLYETVT